jgi:hypothetical protein
MKLSEAMLAGAELVPAQTCNKLFEYGRDEQTGALLIVAACALGFAYLGIHPEAVYHPVSLAVAEEEIDRVWPELNHPVPSMGYTYAPLGYAIADMNDKQGRGVKAIARELALANL